MGQRKQRRSTTRERSSKDASADKEDDNTNGSVKRMKKGSAKAVAGPEVAKGGGKRNARSRPRPLPVAAKESVQPEPHATAASSTSTSTSTNSATNPLLKEQQDFLSTSITAEERDNFFSNEQVTPERRAEIWELQSHLGEELINKYSWATPDARALRIIRHFAPIVEIGCGSNAYWCQQMKLARINVVGYDKNPDGGGKIHQDGKKLNISSKGGKQKEEDAFVVRRGGPEALAQCQDRTLFLCYPDEEVNDDQDHEKDSSADTAESMAEACLQHYKGDYIIHVGELFLDPTFSLEQAPWGRSSSPAFQERLAAEFHCILRVTLPNWLHTADRLTVWKRSPTTVIAYADDESNGKDYNDDEDMEEMLFRHIPKEERLPVDIASPCVAHLLEETVISDEKHVAPTDPSPTKTETEVNLPKPSPPKPSKRKHSSGKTSVSPSTKEEPYACPW